MNTIQFSEVFLKKMTYVAANEILGGTNFLDFVWCLQTREYKFPPRIPFAASSNRYPQKASNFNVIISDMFDKCPRAHKGCNPFCIRF